MGSAASKPAKSAASAAARRQYPKKPTPPPTGQRKAPKETKAAPTPEPASAAPNLEYTPSTPHAPAPSSQGPTYHSKEPASGVKSDAIDMDGRDPDFAASLRSIGPVNPNPTYSNSSTVNGPGSMQTIFPRSSNPALLVINARQRLNKLVEEEAESYGVAGHPGRQFLDALTIQQVLTMRDKQGMSRRQIEKFLGLKSGVVDRLGKDAIVSRIA
ncbi:hypothetical protein PENANT_c028G09844 [Penicillium antarcticum]|uniref:Helix-turn-helix domain-containing protein n=1 Tax=Penicillium antarcticum TaxID=416450 RepID=A0A1V6PWA6_9EURO|nr:uncharacterized protein N7508_009010 [Penicillium antarcticum]KAJ5294189.1 hypothetical protein N7508_009010 [Penicillium antarcticum]OQD81309.1 hypothetical protein PENANT_c028G09844 [Penicillium antarcticum]